MLNPTILRALLSLPLCCLVVAGQGPSGVAIDRGDAQRSGVYATNPVAVPGEKLWQSEKIFLMARDSMIFRDRSPYWLKPVYPSDYHYSTPVVHDGVIYFSLFLGDGTLLAVDANTGELKWKNTRPKEEYSPPTIVGDTLFVGSGRLIQAIDLKTQREIWSFTVDGEIPVRAAPLVASGLVYVGSSKGKFYALDGATGDRKWTFELKGPSEWRPPVYADGKIIFAEWKGGITALNAGTGRELWKIKPRKGVYYLLLSGNTLFYVDSDRSIHAVDSISGAEKANFPKKHQVASQLAAADGKLYFAGGDGGNILALDQLTGEMVWKYSTRTYCREPALAGNVLYVTCRDQKIHALDTATGKKLWAKDTGQRELSPPVIAGGALYFIADDGKVHAIK